MITSPELPQVYSAREIARAAGVRTGDVRRLAGSGAISALEGGRFFAPAQAVAAVRLLRGLQPGHRPARELPLFRSSPGVRRQPAIPLALSGTLHAGLLALVALVTSLGLAKPQARIAAQEDKALRMVYLISPGPGGGGGGGGRTQPDPPPAAKLKGAARLRSPIPIRRPPPRIDPPPVVRHVEPPPVKREEPPPVAAPVVAVAADPVDRAGIPWPKETSEVESHGDGQGGGTGTGQGTGLGPGDGAGIGAGSGGGTGGGPYRPGAGITPPSILSEVKPDYTDEGRRRNVEGDVVLEIVVRADGTVGSVKTLQGLGAGLDQRAADAVRQWRFNPARRYGTPVDVIVEVAVEFKLR